MRHFILFLFILLPSFASAQSATDFGKSLAREGVGSAKSGVSSMDAQGTLGVSSSGGVGGNGRSVNAQYSQVLESSFQCPVEAGQTGRYDSLMQFSTTCESKSPSSKRFWLCLPDDPNDTVDSSCGDGHWESEIVEVGVADWTTITRGVEAKITTCEDTDCDYQVKKSGDFSGGQAGAEQQGQSSMDNANGINQVIQNQGAYLPDGTPLQPGSNPNSGDYAGEMVAAGSVGACANDVKASIENGTPVFTCDGKQDVGTFGNGGKACKDIETCIEEETTTDEYTKKCTASIAYAGASCKQKTPTKTCTIQNRKETFTCERKERVRHISTIKRVRKCKLFKTRYSKDFSTPWYIYAGIDAKIPDYLKVRNIRAEWYSSVDIYSTKVEPSGQYSNFDLRFADRIEADGDKYTFLSANGSPVSVESFDISRGIKDGGVKLCNSDLNTRDYIKIRKEYVKKKPYLVKTSKYGRPAIGISPAYKRKGYEMKSGGFFSDDNVWKREIIDGCGEYSDKSN